MMLKCNGGRLHENELCVKGERILTETTPRNHHHHHQPLGRSKQITQEVKIVVNHREQPTRSTSQRKTLKPHIVESFSEQICGELLKNIRNSAEIDDFKRYIQHTNVNVKSDELNRKYSQIYYEFFGVHYEHLKTLNVE